MSTAETFDDLVSQAFSFLVTEFEYKPQTTMKGHYPGAWSKRFSRDDQSVLFFSDIDTPGRYGFLFELARPDIPKSRRLNRYRAFYNYSLRRLIELKCIDCDLPTAGPMADAILAFSEAARLYATDELAGDLKRFPELVYLLEVVASGHPANQRTVGVFSTVEGAISAALDLPAHMDPSDIQFDITGREVDLKTQW